MAAGFGNLVGQLMFPNLDQRVARDITPDPRPLAQQGDGGKPGTVDSLGHPSPAQPPPGANLAPSASTQGDPINSSYTSDLLDMIKRDRMAEGISRGMGEISAGFGTAQQQASKQQALRQGGVGDSLGDLAGIQKMQGQTIQDNEHARFMANADVFAKTLSAGLGRPVSREEAMEIMNDKVTKDAYVGAAGGAEGKNAELTSTVKDANEATRAWAKANPNATPQQIDDYRANLIAGGMGGSDLEQRQYLAEKASGLTTDDYPTWKAKHLAEATTLTTTAKDKAENRVDAEKDYPFMDQTLSKSEGIIKKLLANKKATIDAINTMPSRKEGWWAANTPWGASDEVRTQAGLLKELLSGLAGDNLKTVKNLRNRQEFQTLADSITARLQAGSTDEGIETSLNDLLNKISTSRSIAREQAGLPPLEKKEAGKDGEGSGDEKPPVPNAKQAKDGHWYVPDPDRQGKYLRVD